MILLPFNGQIISIEYDHQGTSFGEISYSYDQKGNVLSKTDPFGLTSNFVYDENDHLIEVIDAMGNRSFYEYNSFGNLIKIILPNGSVREIQYDEFERPISLK